VDTYYTLRGWDTKTGRPTRETLTSVERVAFFLRELLGDLDQ
jgi:aldehyde:ferredoxin oxidoreductase